MLINSQHQPQSRICTWCSRSYRRHLSLWQKITQLGQFCRRYLGYWRNMCKLLSCVCVYRSDISSSLGRKLKIILGDLDLVFGGVESSLDSRSAFLKLSSSLSKLSSSTESHEKHFKITFLYFIHVFIFLSCNSLPCTHCSCIASCSLSSSLGVKMQWDKFLHQMVQSLLLLIDDVLVVCQCRVQIFSTWHDHVSVRKTSTLLQKLNNSRCF